MACNGDTFTFTSSTEEKTSYHNVFNTVFMTKVRNCRLINALVVNVFSGTTDKTMNFGSVVSYTSDLIIAYTEFHRNQFSHFRVK